MDLLSAGGPMSETRKGLNIWSKGRKHTEESKKKMSLAKIGSKMPPRSDEHRQKISKIHKGKILSDETKSKISKSKKGKPSSRKGAILSDETKQKIREANLGKITPDWVKEKISLSEKGRSAWNKGKTYSSPKQSLAMSMENNSNWKGGISFELYPREWVDDLRDSIRKRDSYMCQICGVSQNELTGFHKKLPIHHINYDKNNLNPNNLITLCNSCHIKTNYNRDYWIEYFNGIDFYE